MIARQIARLDAEGWTVMQIADALGMTRFKVRRMLAELDPPITDPQAPATAPLVDSHAGYADLDRRIDAGTAYAHSLPQFNAPNRKATK